MDDPNDVGLSVPGNPAPIIPLYPQFAEAKVPVGCSATRAYRGWLRPFSDDATACRVLRAIVADQPLTVTGGRLDSSTEDLLVHRLEAYLTDMAVPCQLMILEFDGKQHHKAYLLDPVPIRGRSGSLHVWWDKTIVVDGRRIPELCIYSGNLFVYDDAYERLPQFLNQVSVYVAKHLIFLRTRELCRRTKEGKLVVVKARKPSEPIRMEALALSAKFVWFGTWVGKSAPHGYIAHLKTVDPSGECWCNSGEIYSKCHRTRELALAVKAGYLAKTFAWP